MNDYVIVTDSSCDLPDETVKELGIDVVPLNVLIDDNKYYNYLDEKEITFTKIYELLRSGKVASTSAPNVSDFNDIMKPILDGGKDILYIGFSSGLSCTYSTAVLAAKELKKIYPQRKIYTVDSLCASLGQGLLVYLAAMQMKAGKQIEEVKNFAEETRLNICHIYTVEDLKYLKRGGRISATTAVFGSMLNIKPIMDMNNLGKLVATGKVRGRKASIEQLAKQVVLNITESDNYTIFISHGDCEDDAKYLGNILIERLKPSKMLINYIGPVIGGHSGPGTLAVFFVGNER